MKFCPKCGTKLEDDAVFCSNCGEKQPGFAPKPAAEETAPSPAPIPAAAPASGATPPERYRALMESDETFQTIVKTTKKANLLTLIGLLYLIPLLVSLLVPVGQFTGVEVSTPGQAEFNAMGATFPLPYSALSIQTFETMAGNKAVFPGGSANPMPVILLIFALLFVPLHVLMAVLGTTKGYMLKNYEAGKKAELIKTAKSPTKILFGAAISLLSFFGALSIFLQSDGIKYVYKDSSRYFFGEVASVPSGVITSGIVAGITIVVMIVVYIILRNIVLRPLKNIE